MNTPLFEEIGYGVTCIDAQYVSWGMACFYLLESAGEYALIETGTNHSVGGLLACLAQRDIHPEQIRFIIPTHVHLDHAGGAGAMMALFPRAQLVIHPRGARHMIDPQQLVAASQAVYGEQLFASLYGDVMPIEAQRVVAADDGYTLCFGQRTLLLRHTEGHARHHFCVWDEHSHGWFTGDMFGICYPWFRFPEGDYLLPSTTPTQFDPQAYLRSLELLHSYAPRRIYLTHYGMIEYSASKNSALAQQVQAYRDVALQSCADDGELEARLSALALQSIRAFTPSTDAQQLSDWLQFDIPLNAQGLAHWRSTQTA